MTISVFSKIIITAGASNCACVKVETNFVSLIKSMSTSLSENKSDRSWNLFLRLLMGEI